MSFRTKRSAVKNLGNIYVDAFTSASRDSSSLKLLLDDPDEGIHVLVHGVEQRAVNVKDDGLVMFHDFGPFGVFP